MAARAATVALHPVEKAAEEAAVARVAASDWAAADWAAADSAAAVAAAVDSAAKVVVNRVEALVQRKSP